MSCCQNTGTPGQPPFREAGDIGAEKAGKVVHSGSKNGLCVACVQHSATRARPEGLREIKGKPKAGAAWLATLAGMDRLLIAADSALRTVFATHHASRPNPAASVPSQGQVTLSEAERREAAALMRVNHVGEVCAQALYTAQAMATQDAELRQHLLAASAEETDHLAWTEERLRELGDRTSWLNPLWYAGAFAIGFVAGKLGGDQVSLGFVVETERQVEAHLQGHMDRMPAQDQASRDIVAQMKADEVRHADEAQAAGGVDLPAPVKGLMRLAAKVMTTVAHRV